MNGVQWSSIILIIILFIGINVTSSSGIDLEKKSSNINPSGTVLYVGGVEPGNYTTIQAAINDASDGDTIFVYDDSSPYYENIWISKGIKLIGENRNTTIITGIETLEPVIGIYSITSEVLVSGFTITDNLLGLKSCIGISIFGNNNIIQGNKIVFNLKGIELNRDSDNNIITENIILHNSYVGIFDEGDNARNIVKWNVIGGNGRENPDIRKGGLYKHLSGGDYHHNDFDLNWGENAYTETSIWGDWDDGSEGNYWDNWPGYPDYYTIKGTQTDQIDNYPTMTPYINHTIVCIKESYEADTGEVLSFSADTNKPSSSVSWLWEFGDGTISTQKSPDYVYNKSGIYEINVTVTDTHGVSDTDKSIAYIGIPPDTPTIKGPTKGRPWVYYEYSIVATDPDSDYITYYIDWSDGWGEYIEFVPSGEIVKIKHQWEYQCNITISVQAIDETLRESEWAYLNVEIPRTRASSYHWFEWFLERFPILERLLNLSL